MNTQLLLGGFLGLQGQEIWLVLVLVLLLFGAKKLPELARGLGKSLGEFRKAKDEFEQEIHKAGEEVRTEEPKGKRQHEA